MKKIREIIRLKETCNLSKRKIARALGVSRPVVDQYLSDFYASGLDYKEISNLPDDKLLETINNNKKIKKNEKLKILSSKFEYFTKELKRVGVTKHLLWEEYIQEHPDGYSYSQFCHYYLMWQNTSEISMHIDHKAGDKMFVDFTGKKMSIVDRHTGEVTEVEIFISVLGASQLTYVEAVPDQKKESWLRVNENSLRYFGGVPRAIVPDCLKSAVTKGDKYEPEINPEYNDFARHYNTTILPARPYKPKDKALVEGAVKIVYSWIFARLRNEVFFSLEELNRATREMLDEYNGRLLQKLKISRRELFLEVEQSELNPLPIEHYELKSFKKLTVAFNYHIYMKDDEHYYSIPYQYRGKDVEVMYNASILEVYYNNIRIAFHSRINLQKKYETLPGHMPPNHKWVNDWNPDKFINWAAGKGHNVKQVIEAVLAKNQYPEQSYKVCMGILSLAKKYTNVRLNLACKRALYYEKYSYKWINNILTNKLEAVDEEQNLFEQPLPDHENIRGNKYYNKEDYNE